MTKHHTMKSYKGSGGKATSIPSLGSRWRWAVSLHSGNEAEWALEPVW